MCSNGDRNQSSKEKMPPRHPRGGARHVEGSEKNKAAALPAVASPNVSAVTAGTIDRGRGAGTSPNASTAGGGSTAPFRSTIARGNNSWYQPAAGESVDRLRTGGISPPRSWKRPGWEKQDKYTKNRNAASDPERYSYVTDCSDVAHRDYSLRFASPSQGTRAPGAYTVLPDLRFASGDALLPSAVRAQKAAEGIANASTAARAIHCVALDAHRTLMSGIQSAPGRFTVVRNLPPLQR